MKKSILFLASLAMLSQAAIAGSMTCTLKPRGIAIGNGNSPNNLYLIDGLNDWYDLGFYDGAWVKGYQGVLSIAMNMGQNVTIIWRWPDNTTFPNCQAMVNKPQYIYSVRSGG